MEDLYASDEILVLLCVSLRERFESGLRHLSKRESQILQHVTGFLLRDRGRKQLLCDK